VTQRAGELAMSRIVWSILAIIGLIVVVIWVIGRF
jgi:flagellar biogenesis protein FliO